MNADENLEAVQALYQLCSVILGKLEATQIAQDALAGVLVRSSPAMLKPLRDSVRMLADAREPDVQPAALESFRNNIAAIEKRLASLG